MKIFVLFILILMSIKSTAQKDSLNLNRKESIRLNSLGLKLHKGKKYIEAIDYFNKAIKTDSTFGDAYYNRAVSIINANKNEFIDFDKCNEFKKAIKYGKVISKEELFFYGCTLKNHK